MVRRVYYLDAVSIRLSATGPVGRRIPAEYATVAWLAYKKHREKVAPRWSLSVLVPMCGCDKDAKLIMHREVYGRKRQKEVCSTLILECMGYRAAT